MGAFTGSQAEIQFKRTVDSKGRVTIPADIRTRLSIKQGNSVTLEITESHVIQEQVDSQKEALRLIDSLDDVRSFSYQEGVVEVLVSDRG